MPIVAKNVSFNFVPPQRQCRGQCPRPSAGSNPLRRIYAWLYILLDFQDLEFSTQYKSDVIERTRRCTGLERKSKVYMTH